MDNKKKVMKNKLFKSDKITIQKSNIHGYGVFANQDIKSGELLEECHFIEIDNPKNNLAEYAFDWPNPQQVPFVDKKLITMPFGYACMYNSSTDRKTRNAKWSCDLENNLYVFSATKDIKSGEEIFTYYGGGYWNKYRPKLWHHNVILVVDNLMTPEMHDNIIQASKSPLNRTTKGGIYEQELDESIDACDHDVTLMRRSKLTWDYEKACFDALADYGAVEDGNLTIDIPKKYPREDRTKEGIFNSGAHLGVQYMTYDKDQHFDWHQDCVLNKLAHIDKSYWLNWRSWSVSTFLNDDYEGGIFRVLDIHKNEITVKPKKYRTVFFRSFLPHKVDKITSGRREQAVHWIYTEDTYQEQEKQISNHIRNIYNKGDR